MVMAAKTRRAGFSATAGLSCITLKNYLKKRQGKAKASRKLIKHSIDHVPNS